MARIPEEALVRMLRRLLRPVVRQVLAWGASYPLFDSVARSVFVEVAEDELGLPRKRLTDSRASLVTGLHRKEIARLRRQPRGDRSGASLETSIVTRVIGCWMARPPYASRAGRARALPYDAPPGEASFAALVAHVGFDGTVRSVLDEMLRAGAVRWLEDGRVELIAEVHLPTADLDTKLELLGSEPAELFSTIAHNIEQPAAPWLQRKVAYDRIGADALPALRAALRSEGEGLIRRANALIGAKDRDSNPDAPGGPRTRVAIATYYFEEPVADPDAPGPAPVESVPSLPGRIVSRTVKKRPR
jgi:hypothetical protein